MFGYSSMTITVFLVLQSCANALDNGVARTPPMGYNTWYDVGGDINESYIQSVAAAMQARGLVAAGYTHLNLDDGFIAPSNRSSSFESEGIYIYMPSFDECLYACYCCRLVLFMRSRYLIRHYVAYTMRDK